MRLGVSERAVISVAALVFGLGLTPTRAEPIDYARSHTAEAVENQQTRYYWKSVTAGNSAQLLTLFCSGCDRRASKSDIPLVSVLRDTLGDSDPKNDRLSYVWLLSYRA